jgi:DNA repair protein SbcD/Mre11
MGDWCFVHAADLHLDTPFTGLRDVAPRLAHLLRDASLDVLDRLVDLAIERGALFVVLAGDLYDGSQRGLRAQVRFHTALRRLDEAGIAAFVVHGNHDPVEEGWQAIRTWPERVTVFGADEVRAVPLRRDGETIATVHGISYAHREMRDNLARSFSRPDGVPGVHVGLLHATVGSTSEHEPYAPCTLEDLRAARLDYWALGHIHRRSVLHRGTQRGDPWVVYSGNTQGRSFKPSERGPKGCYVVPVHPNAPGSPIGAPEFVALDAARFEEVELDIGDLGELHELHHRLEEQGRQVLQEAAGRAVVLRARLTGRSALHTDLARAGAREELLSALRDGARATDPPTWWERLLDDSAPEIDRGQLAGRDDFAGELVRRVDQLREDPDALQRLEDQARVLADQLRPPPRTSDIDDLLAAAEQRALQLLDQET